MKSMALALSLTLPVAAMAAEPLVDADWLSAQLGNETVVVLDIRNRLDGGSREAYAEGHIPGAVHSDYLKDGWRTKKEEVVGVVSDVEDLEELISGLGIGGDDHVVISHGGVSASDFGSAARVYWTFKYLGHDEVSILDGGWRGWIDDSVRPVETGITERSADTFVADVRPELLVSTDDVKMSFANPDIMRVDARPIEQFLGQAKHDAASRAGRLPDAVQFDQSQLIGDDGKVKNIEELRQIFAITLDSGAGKEIYSYCNTGHWASTNWFVMSELLGAPNVRLYDQSMVGWTADPANPVDTGNPPKI